MAEQVKKESYNYTWQREHGNAVHHRVEAVSDEVALEDIRQRTKASTKYDTITVAKASDDGRAQWRFLDGVWLREDTIQQLANTIEYVEASVRRMRILMGGVLRISDAIRKTGVPELVALPIERANYGAFSDAAWAAQRQLPRHSRDSSHWQRSSAEIKLRLGGVELKDGHWVLGDPERLTWTISGKNAGKPYDGDRRHGARDAREGSVMVSPSFRLPPEPFAILRYCAGLCEGPANPKGVYSIYDDSWHEKEYAQWVEKEGNVAEVALVKKEDSR